MHAACLHAAQHERPVSSCTPPHLASPPLIPSLQAATEWARFAGDVAAAQAAPRASKPGEDAWRAGPHATRLAAVAALALGDVLPSSEEYRLACKTLADLGKTPAAQVVAGVWAPARVWVCSSVCVVLRGSGSPAPPERVCGAACRRRAQVLLAHLQLRPPSPSRTCVWWQDAAELLQSIGWWPPHLQLGLVQAGVSDAFTPELEVRCCGCCSGGAAEPALLVCDARLAAGCVR